MKRIHLQDVARSEVSVTLSKGERLLDPVCGIMRSIIPNVIEQGDPRIYAFGAVTCHTDRLGFSQMVDRLGGASTDREGALAATIGEAVERYCAAYYEPEDLVLATHEEVASDAVHPSEFGLFSDRQYKTPRFYYEPFTPKTPVTWTWGYSLQHNRKTLVPARFTYLPFYTNRAGGERNITHTTSTGLTCGGTLEEAILSGLGEVVERDALACFWLNRLLLPHIEIDRGSRIHDVFQERFSLPGLKYYVCDATTDLGIPVIFTLLVGNSNSGRMVNAGSQANLSPHKAALKSLVEAAQGRPYLRFAFQKDPDWQCARDFSNIRSFSDTALVYTRTPQLFDKLDFVTDPRPTRKLSEMKDLSTGSVLRDIRVYLSHLRRHNIDVIVVDLTAPDIQEMGLKVVRVITPGLQLLHGDHLYPFLGCSRLYRVPEAMGYQNGLVKEEELNPYWGAPL